MNKDRMDKYKEYTTLAVEQKRYGIVANNDYTGLQFKKGDLINQAVSEMLRLMIQKIEFTRALTALESDVKRIYIAAKNDEQLENKAIDVNDAKWDLETFIYGGNFLGSIGASAVQPQKMEGSTFAKIMGSGLSGASAGAMIGGALMGKDSSGPGWGAALGGIGGMLMGSS
jgi:hypothetical protein